jgi:hypothetical protein
MNIEHWLRELGLEQYEVAFRENAMDGKVLVSLTVQDLKDCESVLLGIAVTFWMHFCSKSRSGSAQLRLASRPLTRDTAECRQVTVTFSDPVG